MATRQAGTLITTHNATYIPPALMPTYQGHVPTIQYNVGSTYGTKSQRYFQDYRNKTLTTSGSPWHNGGQFAAFYTHDPGQVISERARTRDKWLSTRITVPTETDRRFRDDMALFRNKLIHNRDYYRDKTGTIHRVELFHLPTAQDDINKSFVSLSHPCYINPRSEEELFPRKLTNLN